MNAVMPAIIPAAEPARANRNDEITTITDVDQPPMYTVDSRDEKAGMNGFINEKEVSPQYLSASTSNDRESGSWLMRKLFKKSASKSIA